MKKILIIVLALCLIAASTVTVASASGTHLNKKSAYVYVDMTYKVSLLTGSGKTISPSKVKWSSSDTKVAKVSKKGVVTGVGEGFAQITAKYKKSSYTFVAKVRMPYSEEEIRAIARSEIASASEDPADAKAEEYAVRTCVNKPIALDGSTGMFIFGDSTATDAHGGGFTWGSLIADRTGCKEHNFAVSGAAFAHPLDPGKKILNQVKSVADWSDCDICFVAAGTNDGLYNVSAAELRQGVQGVIDEIRKNAPGAEIVFITPTRTTKPYRALLPQIAGAICNTALINDCSVINGFDFPITLSADEWVADLTDGDGLHPNADGKKIYARSVMNALF